MFSANRDFCFDGRRFVEATRFKSHDGKDFRSADLLFAGRKRAFLIKEREMPLPVRPLALARDTFLA